MKTHVGHEEEIRTQRLSKKEQEYLVDQLKAGVTTDRILKNVRITKNEELSKLNLVTKNDLRNLVRRKNINEVRHCNDMVATAMRVQELNAGGKDYVFLFKQIGTDMYLTVQIHFI